MNIPEVTIFNALKDVLAFLKEEGIDTSNHPGTSWIERIFRGNKINSFDMVKEAKAILLTESTRRVYIGVGYNMERASNGPCIHIITPSLQSAGSGNAIGFDRDYVPSFTEYPNSKKYHSFTRRFSHTINLLITAPNMNEVLLLFYFLTGVFVANHDRFANFLGTELITVGGQDISFQQDLVPMNIFHRNFTISFDFDITVDQMIEEVSIENFSIDGKISI